MNICHIIGIFSPEHGGPVVSCCNYVCGQAARGDKVMLWTVEGYPHTSPAVRLPASIGQYVTNIDWPQKLGASKKMRRALADSAPADVYHLHGIWLRVLFYGYKKARREKRPYLIEINGALDPLELASKPWRKRLVRWWYQDRMLHEAPCIHVNSEREARHVRALGFTAPIVVIPAGFNFREFDALAEQARVTKPEWASKLEGRRVLLFLSRIHPAKGIDDLMNVWSKLAPEFPDWDLVLAGPGEPEMIVWLKAQIANARLEGRCHWVGLISDVERAWAYTHADLYVLPSHKENFGNTVQEALGYGTPVITTTQTPWTELKSWGCGWVCEDNTNGLGETLAKALAMSHDHLSQMGRAGREKILQQFSLDKVIDDQLAVYAWLLGGAKPRCLWTA